MIRDEMPKYRGCDLIVDDIQEKINHIKETIAPLIGSTPEMKIVIDDSIELVDLFVEILGRERELLLELAELEEGNPDYE